MTYHYIDSNEEILMADHKPLILVDGSSYLFRAFHIDDKGRNPMQTSTGKRTGAVRIVGNMLRKLVKDYKPDEMVVVFDAKGKTFRTDMVNDFNKKEKAEYPGYKANRPPMPDELREQIESLHELVVGFGYPMVVESGVEADDVIGTLAKQADAEGKKVVISTSDKDMAQLVTDNVTLLNTMRNRFSKETGDTILDIAGVTEKFGVRPDQIIDYLAMIGDTSDNIRGVNKVGPKTAVKWLAQYDSLDNIVENAEEFGGKVGEYLREAIESKELELARQLVTIDCEVKLKTKKDGLKLQKPDLKKLMPVLKECEFTTWLKEFGDGTEATSKNEDASDASDMDYKCITSERDFRRLFSALRKADLIAFDTETTSLDYIDARIVGLSFSIKPKEAYYLPLAHDYEGAPTQLPLDETLERLKPLLEDPELKKVGHNLKYDKNVLLNHDIELQGIQHDTMVESYVNNSTASRHDLNTLSERYLQHENIQFSDVAGKGKDQVTFDKVPIDKATPYAAEDADVCLRLHEHFWPQLKNKDAKAQRKLYEEIEVPLIPVLAGIERNGVRVDDGLLLTQSHELEERMRELEEETYGIAGKEFNLGSPKQLQTILFEEQQIPVVRKTPKGQPSTAEDVLQELAHEHDLPRLILEYRSISKLKSTYTDKLPLQINSTTGRVHTSYHQAVASTGRLSSSDPNLQNIPIRTAEGRRIRQAFVPGHKTQQILLAADYSQIELRIMAHLSGDKGLLDAFAAGKDIHSATAAEVFAEDPDNVDKESRRRAKAINFGLIYGMSAFGLAKQLKISRTEAQAYVETYFERYPGVQKYMDKTKELAKEQGYVETLFGRRLYLPDINAKNVNRRNYAERTAINAPMQGTAADIIKLAMIDIHDWCKDREDVRMIMQVHDELVFEVEKKSATKLGKEICKRMEAAAKLDVPLVVDADQGKNWDEAH